MAISEVQLAGITQGAGKLKALGPEDLIVHTARVSNPKNQSNYETGPKLLKYCIKNRHWSIFETVHMTVEITTSRVIAEQIMRHRSATFQQFSQRYAEADANVIYDARRQDTKNRQASVDDLPADVKDWFRTAQETICDAAYLTYKTALGKGIAKECARFVLPLSTQTTLYMTMNVRGWIHYVDLRSGNGTQLEHTEIALKIRDIMKEEFPSISQAMGWM
jgi:thymidylate synthase (FAD)